MKNVIGKQSPIASFPAKRFSVPVDAAAVRASGLTNATDSIAPEIQIEIGENKNYLTLAQLTMLNILAPNNCKRPIFLTSPYNEIGFGPYLRQEGIIFRLVPVRNNSSRSMDVTKSDSLLRTVFRSGNAN